MGTNRAAKLAGTLKKKVSGIVLAELKDPRIGFVTVTDVQVTPDLRYVKIFYSVLGTEKQKKAAAAGLKHATGFVRLLIAKEIKLRFAPEIVFKFDDTHEQQVRVIELLERIKREDEQRAKGNSDSIKDA
jgi:ribosome-binding factor A